MTAPSLPESPGKPPISAGTKGCLIGGGVLLIIIVILLAILVGIALWFFLNVKR